MITPAKKHVDRDNILLINNQSGGLANEIETGNAFLKSIERKAEEDRKTCTLMECREGSGSTLGNTNSKRREYEDSDHGIHGGSGF